MTEPIYTEDLLGVTKIIFTRLWKDECYNGITHAHIDACRKGGSLDAGGRVEKLEEKSKEIAEEIMRFLKGH